MSAFHPFLKSGHAPTLFAAFFYFAFSCAIWVLNGAMAPFIKEAYQLTAAQQGLMLSIPIVAGALMRFPLGVLAQYIGRKNATLVEMGLVAVAMVYGLFFVDTFGDLRVQLALPALARLRQVHQRAQAARLVALHHPGVHARIQCTLQRFRIGVLGEEQHGHRLLGLQGGNRLQQLRRGAGRPANEHVGAQPQRVAHQVRAIALAADGEPCREEVGGEIGRPGIGRMEQENGGHGCVQRGRKHSASLPAVGWHGPCMKGRNGCDAAPGPCIVPPAARTTWCAVLYSLQG